MLLNGELDARLEPEYPVPFLKGDPRCVQLFPDPKAVEIDYFKRTGIFPIMHVTVVKREVVDAWFEQERLMGPDPWKYGLGPENRKTLEKAIEYTQMQGLISRRWSVDELFSV